MPRKKWIDKSKATTYQLVHRAQNDPLIHDASSSSMVFRELAPTQSHKPKNRRDLENELFGGSDVGSVLSGSDASALSSDFKIRDNEGEVAEHGVFYDDTEYDYMQHLRDIGRSGAAGASAVWIDAQAERGKGKHKQSLADALAAMDLEHARTQDREKGKLVDPSILPSAQLRQTTYQDQQDVPDALAGFQPDMDPRLREVLEALEDDAYIDANEGEDFLAQIAEDRREVSLEDFEDSFYEEEWMDEDGDGWESDRTVRPGEDTEGVPKLVDTSGKSGAHIDLHTSVDANPPPDLSKPSEPQPLQEAATDPHPDTDHGDGAFMASFRNLPSSLKKPTPNLSNPTTTAPASQLSPSQPQPQTQHSRPHPHLPPSLLSSHASSLFGPGGKRKKRKGALTSTTSFSMTSSSLARTEGLHTLDARFDRVLASYMEDEDDEYEFGGDEEMADDNASAVSGMSGMSKASGVSRTSGASRASRASGVSTASRQSALDELVSSRAFGDAMDEFLAGEGKSGRPGGKREKRGKRGGAGGEGLKELDEIRAELGRGRLRVGAGEGEGEKLSFWAKWRRLDMERGRGSVAGVGSK